MLLHRETGVIRDGFRSFVLDPRLESARLQHRRIDFPGEFPSRIRKQAQGIVLGSIRSEKVGHNRAVRCAACAHQVNWIAGFGFCGRDGYLRFYLYFLWFLSHPMVSIHFH